MELFFEIFGKCNSQGPGSKEATELALKLTGMEDKNLSILDIGCGTGKQTIYLNRCGFNDIVAVDNSETFISILKNKIKDEKIRGIRPQIGSMFDLPFKDGEFDLIWAEGSIYIIGFEKGLKEWKKHLKRNGIIAVSEISYIRDGIPDELSEYWLENYPEMADVSKKIEVAEKCGYTYMGSFVLNEGCWTKEYYIPFFNVLEEFRKEYESTQDFIDLEKEMKEEYQFYRKYKDYYSYVFYILKKN